MFKILEKLINEHGSAKILKERLGLKDDQIAALKQELTSLTQDNDNLISENKELKISLNQANQEINRLQIIIHASTKSASDSLGGIESQILNFLFDNNDYFRIEQIAKVIGTDSNTTKYHVNNLLDRKLLHDSLRSDGPTTYNINNNGIKYIVEAKNT